MINNSYRLLLILIFIFNNVNSYNINRYDKKINYIKKKDYNKYDYMSLSKYNIDKKKILSSAAYLSNNNINNNSIIIPSYEWNALYDLYNSTNGDYWIWQNETLSGLKWNFTNDINNSNVCLWQGLSCSCTNTTEYHQYRYDERIYSPYGGYYANYYDDNNYNNNNNNNTICFIEKIYLINYNLSGILLPSISNLDKLSHIHLNDNHLYNEIPSTISKLTNLELLCLGINSFSGNIPSSLSLLTNLENLYLGSNQLTGSIPSSLSMLSNLVVLRIGSNQLNGSIPSSFSMLSNLKILHLSSNEFSGSIPSTLSMLSNLEILHLSSNEFSGSIPGSLSMLSNLEILHIYDNHINGSIPSSLSMLSNLVDLYLSFNQLSGSIPSSLSLLTNLVDLFLWGNQLSGSIPSEISKLTNLQNLDLRSNQLSGSIPSSLSMLTNLELLDLFINQLSGSIPNDIGNLTKLIKLSLNTNQLSGSIPSSLTMLTNLEILYLNNNSISGSIPIDISNLTNLVYLYLDNNKLIGSIPSSLSNLIKLEFLDFSNNQLSSSLPSTLQYLINLQEFNVNSNLLNGSLDNVFNSSIQKYLLFIDIGNNSISGSLIEDLFNIQSLQSFVAYSNCITGNIPINICSLLYLNALILDGLSSSSSCKKYIFSQNFFIPLPNSFQLHKSIGTIPECLFNMGSLQTLHLSGIGLEGSIPNSIFISTTLKELALSHNKFSNSIPKVIQNNNWKNLDLSYNNFNGDIQNIKSIKYSIILNNNLLSGDIPLSLINTNLTIAILNGSFFSCSLLNPKLDLPKHDEGLDNYSCGSNNFNVSIVIFSIIIIIIHLFKSKIWLYNIKDVCDFLILSMFLRPHYDTNLNILKNEGIKYSKKILNNELNKNIEEINIKIDMINGLEINQISENLPKPIKLYNNISLLCELSVKLRNTLSIMIYYIIIIWLPMSVLLNYYYSVYKYSYAYTLSSTFLSGIFPSIVMFILMIVSIIGFYYIHKNILFDNIYYKKDMFNMIDKQEAPEFTRKISLFVVFFLDIITMFSINGFFLYATFHMKAIYVFLVEIFVSFIKVIWKWNILPLLTKKIKLYFNKDKKNNKLLNDEVLFQCFVGVINNIIIPLIISTFLSPKCFYNVFVTPEEIKSSYSYYYCSGFKTSNFNDCDALEEITKSTSYYGPFNYSYQCSSSVLTTYSSIYINMAIFLLITEPLKIKFVDYLYLKFDHNTKFFKMINNKISDNLKPIHHLNKDNDIKNAKYFNQSKFIVDIVSYTSIIVTIGFIIPLVGIVCSICLLIYIHNTLSNMGDKISHCNKEEKKDMIEKIINNYEENIQDIYINLDHCLKIIVIPIICVIYAFFIFDILGNEIGSKHAKYLFLIIIMIPLSIVIYEKRIENNKNNSNDNVSLNIISLQGNNNIELRDVTFNILRESLLDIETIRIE